MPGFCYYYVWLFLFDIFMRETLGVTVQTGLYSRVELTGENLDHQNDLESVEWKNLNKSCLCLQFDKKSSNTTNYSPCCGKAHFYLNNNTLILENVTAQDEGVFMETIVNGSGITKTFNFTLYIAHPPNATGIAVTCTTNTSVSLTCEVTATFTHIMWKREDSPILEDDRHSLSKNNQTLNITNMTRSDDGKYSCVATNAYGKSETHTNVICEKRFMHSENVTSNFGVGLIRSKRGFTIIGLLGLCICSVSLTNSFTDF
nr:contactin-5-like isoform X2 [Misgurnus anguillicaudatus]